MLRPPASQQPHWPTPTPPPPPPTVSHLSADAPVFTPGFQVEPTPGPPPEKPALSCSALHDTVVSWRLKGTGGPDTGNGEPDGFQYDHFAHGVRLVLRQAHATEGMLGGHALYGRVLCQPCGRKHGRTVCFRGIAGQ